MKLLASIFVLLLTLASASAAPPPSNILPDHFATWTGNFLPNNTEASAFDASGELRKESGIAGMEACDYSSGANTVHVLLERYRDPSSAYEIYTAMIHPAMEPSNVAPNTAVDGTKLLVLVGGVVMQVSPAQNISTEDLRRLIASVQGKAERTPLPAIRGYLPKGFRDGTQRYTLGPAGFRAALQSLGHSEYAGLADESGFGTAQAEAMLAEYRGGREGGTFLLIEYPTPQLAEQHLHHLEQALTDDAKRAGTTVERKASLLSLVLNPSSSKFATELRNSINYETAVTWNEPHQTATDPPIISAVVKIILFTGGFMVLAVVLGVAFGGVRILLKRFFPGKVFDRPEQMDVLQLGISSKRIDSRDFY